MQLYGTGGTQQVNFVTGAVSVIEVSDKLAGYGITIDRNNHVGLPASYTAIPTVRRYDPETQAWHTFPTQDTFNYGSTNLAGRGVTATPQGLVWAVYNQNLVDPPNWLVGFDDTTGNVQYRVRLDVDSAGNPRPCRRPIGVGIGADGKVWLVSQVDNSICGYDPGAGTFDVVPIGDGPYTYSDFTGNIYRNFTEHQGSYVVTFSGCDNNAYRVNTWGQAKWTGNTPGSSRIEIKFRAAASVTALTAAPFGSPVVFNAAHGGSGSVNLPFTNVEAVQAELDFYADAHGNVPSLMSLDVARSCRFVGGN